MMSRASSFSLKLDPNSKPDGNALRKWVVGFCTIRFDLEQGQVIEECYPPGCLTQDEELEIAFSSFPDSMSQHQNRSSIHDCMFFFRCRRRDGSPDVGRSPVANISSEIQPEIPEEARSGSEDAGDKNGSGSSSEDEEEKDGDGGWSNLPVLNIISNVLSPKSGNRDFTGKQLLGSSDSRDPGPGIQSQFRKGSPATERSSTQNARGNVGPRYIYGYVFNRQRQDERLKRGGEQKSVVILSYRPYSSVFKPLLQILGPLCFDIGNKALEHIASYVSRWPAPTLGKLMELPIGNATLRVYLPPAHSLPSDCGSLSEEFTSAMAPFPPMSQSIPQGLFHDADLFGMFKGLLLQLWELWELLIIGEPVLIVAPTPSQCSEAVAGLVSLVAPFLCSIDFRPYFTIHDPDFARLNSLREGDKFPPMILGVTNLFFLKALQNIPHIVSVGCPSPNSNRFSTLPRSSNGRNAKPDRMNFQTMSLKKFSPSNLLNAVKMRRNGPLMLMTEHKEAIWSSYAATTKPDTAVLNRLIDAGMNPRVEESMSVVNNEILRRHFLELTTNFLAPFGPYFRVTTPLEGTSPFADPPPLPTFDANEFLETLSARGPGKFLLKRMRANWLDLYRHFLRGHNFMPWFQRRRAASEQEQHRLWRQARTRTEIQQFTSKMSELEIVESFNCIERHLLGEIQSQQSGRGNADSRLACQKLKGDLQTVFNLLPKDMQQLLLFNPQRASLLQVATLATLVMYIFGLSVGPVAPVLGQCSCFLAIQEC